MVFQFAGLLTVIVGLNSSRKLFDRDPIWKAILNWLGEARYIIKPKELVKVKSSGTAAISVEGTGKGTVVSNSEKSLDERVQRLEDQLEQLESQLWETKKDLQERDKELKTELAKEQQERQSDSLKIREQIETAAIGGIHIELAGIAYLFLGIALATIPNEIASLLS
ncbi:hypothetical protein [Fodinicurvata fenggangensis]|uniref:hypothetical protein n=1 Tax=Fodinicurvata fenggangensis TaxID=1121830 RepID=UPI00047C1E6D|nr:hypothetical protein [Fodinicurvata fenggangensis]